MYKYYGKQKYLTAVLPDAEWIYSYSAIQLQAELNKLFSGKKLKAIYVSLDGYLEAMHNKVNVIDLSYMGGTALVVFEKTVLQLAIHVEGMFEYRCFPVWEMKLRENYDYPPEDMVMSDRYFFNVADHEITYEYNDKTVHSFTVKGTDTWGFPQPNFDEVIAEEAAQKCDLPGEIILHTNSCDIRFPGDDMEYFWVIFERAQKTC